MLLPSHMETTQPINGFNRMKNNIMVLLMMFASSSMAVENGFFCSNCTYDEAAEIAKREAAPRVHCVISQTPTEDYVEQCSSLTNRYFVVNESSRQIFPFQVFHNNQKSQRQLLTLATRPGSLTSSQQQAILKALDGKLQVFPALMEVSGNMSGAVNTNLVTDPKSALLNQKNADDPHPGGGCNTDGHSNALENALSENYRYNLEQSVRANFQQTLTKSNYSSLREAFTEWKFTGFGMQGGVLQGGFNISWAHHVGAYNLSETYSSSDGSKSELRWSITLNHSNDLEVKISTTTSGIDGFSLAALLSSPTGSLPPKLSTCLLKVLQTKYFASSKSESASRDQVNYFDRTTDMIGRNEQRDTRWVCLNTLFDRNGNIAMQFLSVCP